MTAFRPAPDRTAAPPLRVTAYTGGRSVPSARFRVRQYVSALRALGIAIDERPAWFGSYPPSLRATRPLWAAASLATRLPAIAAGRGSAVTLLQREMISGYFTVERYTRSPRVLDVDDAIWRVRDGSASRKLADACDLVICGNRYLADYFGQWHRRVMVLPTAVDTNRYSPSTAAVPSDAPVIGWCGTSSGLRYLIGIEHAIAAVLLRHPRARLRVVCDKRPNLSHVPHDRIEFIRWSAAAEVDALQGLSIGLMPLEETEWCLGKCSYKMLLYMACGVPVVVTPWGMNREVLALGQVGVAARGPDWVEAIDQLLRNPEQRRAMGANGRRVVQREFSLTSLAPQLAALLRAVGGTPQ